jgi:hypothetical protein
VNPIDGAPAMIRLVSPGQRAAENTTSGRQAEDTRQAGTPGFNSDQDVGHAPSYVVRGTAGKHEQ